MPERLESNVTGRVHFFDDTRGFGFIARDDRQPDVFVHRTKLLPPLQTLEEGQHVAFNTEKGAKGVAAAEVRLLEDAGRDESALADDDDDSPYRGRAA